MGALRDATVVRKIAKELKLTRFKDPERAIREFCIQKVEKIIEPFGKIVNLDRLLEIVSSGLGIRFEEVSDDENIFAVRDAYLAQQELMFADLPRLLDPSTDAVLIRLRYGKSWKYAAVIDCRGMKKARAYFSKWHEVAHILTESPQPSLFRRTPTQKKDAEEALTDRIAGDLAFYTPLFLPELLARTKATRRLTFDVIEDLRQTVCPGASRESTIRGAISRAPFPQLLVIADYGLKKNEERATRSLVQMGLFPEDELPFEPKLRAVDVVSNTSAKQANLHIHRNMEVPESSVIAEAYGEISLVRRTYSRRENLDWWMHSRGGLPSMGIQVQAMKIGKRVFALISPTD
jgi:hypothetical protein